MNPTVPKAELLERERRWTRPTGIATLVGVALVVASVVIQQSAVGSGADTDAERLIQIHDHASQYMFGGVLQGLGFMFFAAPLWFLSKAAQGRSDLVRGIFGVVAVVGTVCLAASTGVRAVGFADVADQFDKELPGLERQERAANRQQQRAGGTGTAKQGTAAEATGSTSTEESSGDEEDSPKEKRAEDLAEDSGTVKTAGLLSLPGLLGFVAGMVYIPLWAMRTGLLSRFFGSLGMALGAVLIILPPAQLILVIWFAALGLMLIGLWPGPRRPAWETGEAIPPQRPGDDPGAAPPGGDIDGSGREVSEAPLPEEPPAPPHPGSPFAGESQGQRRKKRKRRS